MQYDSQAPDVGLGPVRGGGADLAEGVGGGDLSEERLESSEDGGHLPHHLNFVSQPHQSLNPTAQSAEVSLGSLNQSFSLLDGLDGLLIRLIKVIVAVFLLPPPCY